MKVFKLTKSVTIILLIFYAQFSFSQQTILLNGDNYLTTPDNDLYDITPGCMKTFEGWINLCEGGQIINHVHCGQLGGGFYFSTNSSGQLKFYTVESTNCNGPTNTIVTGTTNVIDNQWHHFSLRVIHHNSSVQAVLTVDGNIEDNNTVNTILTASNSQFRIGAYLSINGSFILKPKGRFRDFRVYDRYVPDNELGLTIPSTVGEYAFFDFQPNGSGQTTAAITSTGVGSITATHYTNSTSTVSNIMNSHYLELSDLTLSAPPTSCKNSPLTINVNTTGIDYTWEVNDGNGWTTISTGSINPSIEYTPLTTGNYEFKVTNSVGECHKEDVIVVLVEECCPMLQNNIDYVNHQNGEVINIDTYWEGTHYVEANSIITVLGGATLDLTNVDIIFGECSGIDFKENATANINNSVLRTCDEEKTWRGLYFYPTEGSVEEPFSLSVNESTFKNAIRGINVDGVDNLNSELNITNNLFSDNHLSLSLTNQLFNGEVTGNTFKVDKELLFNDLACDLHTNNVRYGISTFKVNGDFLISQNDFINSNPSQNLILKGIFLNFSSSKILSNNFNNNYVSIESNICSNINIEDNEISINGELEMGSSQILLKDSEMVNVKHNEFVNSNEINTQGLQSAVSISNASNSIWIKENNIKGFRVGIYIEKSNNVSIVENEIDNTWHYGVYILSGDSEGYGNRITCNTINMFNDYNVDATGIGYFQTDDKGYNTEIFSNCIFETNQAIHTENINNLPNQLPIIRNNYMYNYTSSGVENINMIGDIGISGVVHNNAGRNTFISNNVPNQIGSITTGDIISNVNINQNGNYGVGVFTTNVVGNANASSFHSTASCANQNRWGNNISNEIGDVEVCDFLDMKLRTEVSIGEELNSNYFSKVKSFNEAKTILNFINSEKLHLLETSFNLLIDESKLNSMELKMLTYNYYIITNNYLDAYDFVQSSNNNFLTEEEYSKLNLLINKSNWYDLTDEEINLISPKVKVLNTPTHISGIEVINSEEFALDIFPNPTKGNLVVNLNSTTENPVVKIYDIEGRLLEIQNLNSKSSILNIDVTHLVNGLYIIAVETNDKVYQSKFIKE